MLGFSRISTRQLEGLCRRLSMSLTAGIDARSALAREAERAAGLGARQRLRALAEAVEQGESFHEALTRTDNYFPEMFHAIVRVGEESGHLGESLGQLADHYEGHLRLRRRFLSAITWPVTELVLAVLVIGALIWFLGVIGQSTGHRVDVLGFGLVGNAGLAVYLTVVGAIVILLFAAIHAVQRGKAWVKPVQRFALRLPGIGKPLETLALARVAWALNITLNAGMHVRKALKLRLQSARNAHFADQIKPIDDAVGAGESLYGAFLATGAFPADFLDSLRVAEESGRLVESMGRLSKQYQEQAEFALQVLTSIAAYAVWAVIAAIIILFIFQIFSFYVGAIQGAMP